MCISVYCFYMNVNMYGDFQICIRVPLHLFYSLVSSKFWKQNHGYYLHTYKYELCNLAKNLINTDSYIVFQLQNIILCFVYTEEKTPRNKVFASQMFYINYIDKRHITLQFQENFKDWKILSRLVIVKDCSIFLQPSAL